MFKGIRSDSFALGLAVGIGSTVVVLVYGEAIYHQAQCIASGPCAGYPEDQEQPDKPRWWWWARRLFSTEDTLAQWVMALFTVFAVTLLWLTLRATREMLIEAKNTTDAARDTAAASRDVYKIRRGTVFKLYLKPKIIGQDQAEFVPANENNYST